MKYGSQLTHMFGASLLAFVCAGAAVSESPVDSGALYSTSSAIDDGIDLVLPDDPKAKETRIRVGAGFGFVPRYVGSDEYKFKAIPIVDIRYKRRWRLNYNRLSYGAYMQDGWEIGPFIKYKGGRKEKRSPVLEGLGDIKATGQVGVFAKYKTDRMLFNVEFRQAVGSGQGSSVTATLGHALFKAGDFVMAAAVTGRWRSGKSMQTNFGITDTQASNSVYGLTAFDASSGISDYSVNLLGRYSLGKRVRLLGLARYGRLLGDAAASPLTNTKVSSRNQFKAGLGFTVDF